MATLATNPSEHPFLRMAGPDWFRARRSLWIALVLSVLVHAAWSLWPAEPPKSPDDVVLSATLTEMPAPPAAGAKPAAPKPRPKPKRVVPVAPAEPPATESVASLPSAESIAPDPALTTEK